MVLPSSLGVMRVGAVLSYFASAVLTLGLYVSKAHMEPGSVFKGFRQPHEYYDEQG